MSQIFSEDRPLRVAVFGSGPSGIFAAEQLIKKKDIPVQVDVFDRLPTPYGLVRYGVAPDHLTIKSVTRGFDKTLSDERVRFLGNVELGKDLSYAEARKHYDALFYAVGASSDRRLGIAGEELDGSLSATAFVAWYNGHPDAQGEQAAPVRQALGRSKSVAIIGVGNVALDVSRILAKTSDELQKSDITAEALEHLAKSGIEDIYILGRRGPAQAKFTSKEVREFGDLEDAEPVVSGADLALDEAEEAAITDKVIQKNLELFREFASRDSAGKKCRVHFRFLVSPTEILGTDGAVSGLKIERNRLNEEGRPVGTGETEVLPVQLVLRSVGYKGVGLADVPFDEKRGIIPNEGGRVLDRAGEYTTGWIKRGPSGVIGTNRKCATESVTVLLEDAAAGKLPLAEHPTRAEIDTLLKARGVDVYTFADWQALDKFECSRGEAVGRPRVKVTTCTEMLGQRHQAPEV